jgi:hypothetical protein
MIVADDQHYVSGEPHGSDAMRIYAACSRNPKNLEALERLLPEFDCDADWRAFSGWNDGIALEPFDAGLIIVDLAKKWIYAQDSYFGAHRRGSYSPRNDEDRMIEYEFSNEWQFVAEPKWFRYLESLGLKPYGDVDGPAYEKREYEGFTSDDFDFDDEPETEPSQDDGVYDEEFSSVDVTHANRVCSLVDFKPENTAEERDYQTLEHIAHYDNLADTAELRIKKAQKEISSLKIELQAVENLRQRDSIPRWEIKRIALQAHLGKHDKNISRWTEDHAEAAAMAAELRTLLMTDKGREILKKWEEEGKDDWQDIQLPF